MKLDEISIYQVFQNLLSNAIKHSFEDGKIDINIKENKNSVLISIVDSGIGLTAEEIEKIFTKFGYLRREGDLNKKGWGIGLYSSKKIVEEHDGTIRVESEGRNKGATFEVELPKK